MKMQSDEYSNSVVSDINIVPFIDILLVVLIIFLIVSSATVSQSFEMANVSENAGKVKSVSKISYKLTVNNDGSLELNGKTTSSEVVSDTLRDAVSKDPNAQVNLYAPQSLPHGQVVKVINQIKNNGVKRLWISSARP